MEKLEVGSIVKALEESNTWMHQYDVVGTITKIFIHDDKAFAKILVPKWLIKRNGGKYIIREWVRNRWSKQEDDFLLLDEGILLEHLELCEMPKNSQTIEERVNSLIDQAFGFENNRLGINVVYWPNDLVVTPGICVHQDCDKSRTHLAWHNNHGTVEAFMVCEPHHKELNGRCSDGFPIKTELSQRMVPISSIGIGS